MTKKIKIPDSIEKAEDRLGTLDGIVTATGWERAAIVYAFTYEGKPGEGGPGRTNGRITDRCTISALARLKINGLATKETVIHYRNCWKDAIASGEAQDIQPGDTVILPTSGFPPANRGTDGYSTEEGAKRTVQRIAAKHGAAAFDDVAEDVVERTAKTKPAVVAKQTSKPAVADAIVRDKESRNEIIKGHKRVQSEQKQQSKMRPRAKTDPADVPEKDMTALEVAALITEFHIAADEAAMLSRKAFDAHKKMQSYLTVEQTDDLAEVADKPIDAWQMVKESVISGGVTDDALQDLISQEQGGT